MWPMYYTCRAGNRRAAADIYLKGRGEVLCVSRSYLHLFRRK
jgi:hypothetical protein